MVIGRSLVSHWSAPHRVSCIFVAGSMGWDVLVCIAKINSIAVDFPFLRVLAERSGVIWALLTFYCHQSFFLAEGIDAVKVLYALKSMQASIFLNCARKRSEDICVRKKLVMQRALHFYLSLSLVQVREPARHSLWSGQQKSCFTEIAIYIYIFISTIDYYERSNRHILNPPSAVANRPSLLMDCMQIMRQLRFVYILLGKETRKSQGCYWTWNYGWLGYSKQDTWP